jgi:16S rRNA (adenine1518-N6/adenine1519-N6)-dimethyltransferase
MRSQRQRLGQHFLRDSRIAQDIAASLPADPARVVEIGPGQGALTSHLLTRFPRVRAVELDRVLAARLPGQLGHPPGLEVWPADALKVDLDELAQDGPWAVAGNLPYSVGTPIVRRLLRRPDLFTCLVVMVQREVAERLAAPPDHSERGLLTIECETFADAELLFAVPPRAFAPPPKVTSAVVRLRLHQPRVPAPVLERALALAATAFTHRRKRLSNALSGVADAHQLAAAAERAGVDLALRPQAVALAGWLALAAALPPLAGDSG